MSILSTVGILIASIKSHDFYYISPRGKENS